MRKLTLIVSSLILLMATPAMAGSYSVNQESGVKVYRGVAPQPDIKAAQALSQARANRKADAAFKAQLRRQARDIEAQLTEQNAEIARLSDKIDNLETRSTRSRRGRYGRRYIGNNRFFGRNGFIGNSNFAGASPRLP